ncbi:hypothetical protein IWQ62_000987 [Dispira parvispora]|uniref:PROP1-like PPR domain-containing protein n=1 Tax=Dispira parvispora TaxID=1520584 RepID=A0A9W8ATL8_9FUNG|nr:hypothetical protein IWQ62_000987 [Dispira parvispora]
MLRLRFSKVGKDKNLRLCPSALATHQGSTCSQCLRRRAWTLALGQFNSVGVTLKTGLGEHNQAQGPCMSTIRRTFSMAPEHHIASNPVSDFQEALLRTTQIDDALALADESRKTKIMDKWTSPVYHALFRKLRQLGINFVVPKAMTGSVKSPKKGLKEAQRKRIVTLCQEWHERGLQAGIATCAENPSGENTVFEPNDYNLVVYTCVSVGSLDTAWELCQVAAQRGHPVNGRTLRTFLNHYRSHPNADGVTRVFAYVLRNKVDIDRVSYNIIIEIATKTNCIDLATKALREMQNHDHLPDGFTYASLMNYYGDHQMFGKVNQLYDELQQNNIIPSLVSSQYIIAALGKVGHLEDAWQIYQQAIQYDPRGHPYAFLAIIELCNYSHAFSRLEEIESAVRTTSCIKHHGVVAQLMRGYSYDHNHDRVVALYRSIQPHLPPRDDNYQGIMVGALGRVKEVELAHQLYASKLCLSQLPTSSMHPLLELYVTIGNTKGVHQLLRDAQSYGEDKLSANLLAGFMWAFAKVGQNPTVERLHRLLQDRRDPLTVRSYNYLIAAYGRIRLLNEAFDTFYQMRKRGVRPSMAVFSTLINACNHCNSPERALIPFNLALNDEHNVKPNVFANMMTSFIELNQPDKARQMYDRYWEVVEQPYYEEISELLNNCHKLKDAALAWSTYQRGKRYKVPITARGYQALLRLEVDRAEDAHVREILRDIDEADLVWNEHLFCVLIDYYSSQRNIQHVTRLWMRMKQLIQPTVYGYATAMKAYAQNDLLTEALEINQELDQGQRTLHLSVYHVLLAAANRLGRLDVVVELLTGQMAKYKVIPTQQTLDLVAQRVMEPEHAATRNILDEYMANHAPYLESQWKVAKQAAVANRSA